ncbi:MAG: putative toxin-antitoxin system toxin component, PIN family [Burkholderiales bacterium]
MIDTNVLVSAFLWRGLPGRLLERAGECDVRLFTSQALLNELNATLAKPKLAQVSPSTDTHAPRSASSSTIGSRRSPREVT